MAKIKGRIDHEAEKRKREAAAKRTRPSEFFGGLINRMSGIYSDTKRNELELDYSTLREERKIELFETIEMCLALYDQFILEERKGDFKSKAALKVKLAWNDFCFGVTSAFTGSLFRDIRYKDDIKSIKKPAANAQAKKFISICTNLAIEPSSSFTVPTIDTLNAIGKNIAELQAKKPKIDWGAGNTAESREYKESRRINDQIEQLEKQSIVPISWKPYIVWHYEKARRTI